MKKIAALWHGTLSDAGCFVSDGHISLFAERNMEKRRTKEAGRADSTKKSSIFPSA